MSAASVTIPLNRWPLWLKPSRRLMYTAGIGFGIFLLGYLFTSSRKKRRSDRASAGSESARDDVREQRREGNSANAKSESGSSSRQRFMSERSSTRASLRQGSTTIPSHECQLITGCDYFQNIVQILETCQAGFELLKNRSERDKNRAEMLSSIITRLRFIETDVNRLVTEGGYDRGDLPATDAIATQMWNGVSTRSRRTGSLSLLSDDSFHSCLDDLTHAFDEAYVRETPIDKAVLPFYQQGVEEAVNGRVDFRKSRAVFCGCEDDTEFAAKLWCLRQAFHSIVSDADNRSWLIDTGRQIMCDMLRHDKRETKEFIRVFDGIIEFLNHESNREIMFEELSHRKVAELGVWDVLFDFILLDAFDDIGSPPSAIVAILSNRFITRKMKEASLATVLWTTITAKRKRLRFSDGFMSQFYSITEIVAPALTLAFFGGSTSSFRELCQYFRQEVFHFVSEIFSFSVRYTCLADLTADVHDALRKALANIQEKLGEKEIEL